MRVIKQRTLLVIEDIKIAIDRPDVLKYMCLDNRNRHTFTEGMLEIDLFGGDAAIVYGSVIDVVDRQKLGEML